MGGQKHEHSTGTLHEQLKYTGYRSHWGKSCLIIDHEQQELDNPNLAVAAARGLDSTMLILL